MSLIRSSPLLAALAAFAITAQLSAQAAGAPPRPAVSGGVLEEYDAQYDRTVVLTPALALDSTLSLTALSSYAGRGPRGIPDGVVLTLRSTAADVRFAAGPNAVFTLANGERIDLGAVVVVPEHRPEFTEVLMTSLRAADLKRVVASPTATLTLGDFRFPLASGVLVPLRQLADRLVTP
jgi:hypothetical protein